MKYPRLYVDDIGESHFGETDAKFAPMEYAPPAPPFGVSEATDASRYIFVRFPAGWESEPHPTPRRQLFVVLSGEIEGTASDGESKTFGPGSTLLMEDTEGKGHAARVVSDGCCLKYLGERAPFTDFSLSHGICPQCLGKVREKNEELKIEKLRGISHRLQSMSFLNTRELDGLIEEGTAIGMRPEDLMIGLLQPTLHSVGEKWSRNELSIAEEHRITALVTTIIEKLFQKFSSDEIRQASEPGVLLLCAPGNYHVLGVRMIEFLLVTSRVPCFAVYPGIPNREALALIESLKPPIVGISVAQEEQLESVSELAEMLQADAGMSGTRVVVGGMPFRSGTVKTAPSNVCVCVDIGEFQQLVKQDRDVQRLIC